MSMRNPAGTSQLNQEMDLHAKVSAIVEDMLAARRNIFFGEVVEYDSVTHSVRVNLAPSMGHGRSITPTEEAVTEFIQLTNPWVGTGWGMKSGAVARKAHVLVVRLGYPLGVSFAIGPFNSKSNPPPPGEGGEIGIVHEKGTRLNLKNDGSVELVQDSTDTSLVIDPSGVVTVKSKDIRFGDDGATEPLVLGNAFMELFNTHVHVETDSTTEPPTTFMTQAQLSPIVTTK